MKKLISVFAALALVGSLAAQKGKKPAKAPAKPVVAAPAIPAMPAAVSAAPAAAGAAKGMGLFIDLRGGYTLANGTTTSKADGTTASDTPATAVTYKLSGSAAMGGGVTLGYDIAPGLGLVASYDIRSFKTREYSQFVGGGVSRTIQQKWTNQVIGIGFQPHVRALGGDWYAGAGFALVLPFETTQTVNLTGSTTTKQVEVIGYNLAMGAYGELGYRFMFTDNIGLNIGLRAVVATANNIDKTKVTTTTTSGVDTTATTTYKESFSTDTKNAEVAAGTPTATRTLAEFESLGITDITGNVGVSLKF